MSTQDELKQEAAKVAAQMVESDTVVGLGTGSTVKFFVDFLGERVANEGLNIVGVTTSKRTSDQASSLGIQLKDVDEVDHIDVTIDGADEVDPQFNGIKGGGAAHLWEKIVAKASNKNIWIVDDSKMVDQLGKFPLPTEVIPYGSKQLMRRLEEKGLNPKMRMTEENKPVKTDSNNYVIDLHLEKIDNPYELADYLSNETGLVEHGLFLDTVDTVIVGQAGQPLILNRKEKI